MTASAPRVPPGRVLAWAIWLLAIGLVELDLAFPPGYAVPLLYIPLVVLTMWVPERDHAFSLAAAATVMTAAEFFVSHTGGDVQAGIFNRTLAVLGIWVTALGVRAHRRVEAQLREQAALAHLGRMASVVAHEVRNPLTGVRGAVQVLQGRLKGAGYDDVLTEMLERVDSLSATVEGLLRYSGSKPPVLQAVLVADLVRDLKNETATDPHFAGITIEGDTGLETIHVDPAQLRTVLRNLLINSAQAMEGRGRIQISAKRVGDSYEVRVSDSGPGMPAEVRARAGEPFFTTRHQGTGLGIATARRLLAAHEGTLSFEHPDEGGTTAVIRLPAGS